MADQPTNNPHVLKGLRGLREAGVLATLNRNKSRTAVGCITYANKAGKFWPSLDTLGKDTGLGRWHANSAERVGG